MKALLSLTKKANGGATPRSTTPVTLPLDFLGDASKRLGWVSLFYAFAFTFAYFVPMLTWRMDGGGLSSPNSAVALLCMGISVVVFVLSRSRRMKPTVLLDIGLAYEIVGSFGISMAEFWGIFEEWSPDLMTGGEWAGIPWECVWIVIFPLIAPSTPRKTLLASLGAASTGPLAIRLSQAFGASSPDLDWYFLMRFFVFSTYLCAFLAIFTNRVMYGIGRNIQRAREIGSYHLSELLGSGGMGEVWRAEHRLLARPAAVKLIRPEVLGRDEISRRDALRRFEREAQATASLRSHHTVDLYDFGVTEDGSFYYVMEILDGSSLEELVKRFGPLPAERAVYLLRQVCHSLAEAHEVGLIHRDIKPANIYVCRQGRDRDFVKVLDFGLVKAVRDKQAGGTQLSMRGVVVGTPGYMAPEMAVGEKEIDGRADIYSLGCVAYWMLTGLPVFEGENALATVMGHVKEPPVRPSDRTELPIPKSLEDIIMSCLEKSPDSRPSGAAELEELLAGCDEGKWTGVKAFEWWEMHLPSGAC